MTDLINGFHSKKDPRQFIEKKAVEILLVEDNPGDIRLTQEAFKEWKAPNRLHVVEDGIQALEFLRGQGEYQKAVRPDLILLDLNLPKKSGREILAEVKIDPNLRSIPVIVLTSSNSENDIIHSYNMYANCYIVKPMEFSGLLNVVRQLENFWFATARLPKALQN